MQLEANNLIGAQSQAGTGNTFQGLNPATGESLTPAFASASQSQVQQACELAHAAFAEYRRTALDVRAAFLESIADEIEALGDVLIERAVAETGLPSARITGERGRTTGQLRLFAEVLRDGGFLDTRVDSALPDRAPMPRSDLRYSKLPLGPVAVFGASNFPLAFSVAGGDTASALAAGAPVIVKAHPAHPGTSELVGRALQKAVAQAGLPEGTFSLLFDAGHDVGAALVANPHIKAVAFTGSRRGGLALADIAARRPEPIPVFAEMSSINPLFLLPGALAENAGAKAAALLASVQLGAGQFCTNPGVVAALAGPVLDQFIEAITEQTTQADPQTMLTPAIHAAYERGVKRLAAHADTRVLAQGRSDSPDNSKANGCRPAVFETSAQAFIADPALGEEVFGACTLLVRCRDERELLNFAESLEGQLTVTVHADNSDAALASKLFDVLELKAGRIVFNGFPTGVEVCHAMVHGGPFPATTDARGTSVGATAIQRFLRPVCYQDCPPNLLPAPLRSTS